MANIIGVRFQNAGKLYFFDAKNMWPTPGDYVIVETNRGIEFGEMVTTIQSVDESQLSSPLMPLHRIASAQDVAHHKDNLEKEQAAYEIARPIVQAHKLDMKLVRAAYTFDNSKLMFYFTAEGRVDFRMLVKDLAAQFHTRIEMRQIGVRDEAKMLGELGPCGRPLCCSKFLGDFQPVSIKMAKEQNLSLNPTKISGVCGRLMCCLKFEQEHYETMHKLLPKQGKEVMTPDGPGTVWEVNVLTERIKVRVHKGDTTEVKEYPAEQVVKPGMNPPVPQEQPIHDSSSALSNTSESPSTSSYTGKHTSKVDRKSEASGNTSSGHASDQKSAFRERSASSEKQHRSARIAQRADTSVKRASTADKKELRTPIKREAPAKHPSNRKRTASPGRTAEQSPGNTSHQNAKLKGMAAPVLRSNQKNQNGGHRAQSSWLAAVQDAKMKVEHGLSISSFPSSDEDDTI
mgnify:CR=1 FL=1